MGKGRGKRGGRRGREGKAGWGQRVDGGVGREGGTPHAAIPTFYQRSYTTACSPSYIFTACTSSQPYCPHQRDWRCREGAKCTATPRSRLETPAAAHLLGPHRHYRLQCYRYAARPQEPRASTPFARANPADRHITHRKSMQASTERHITHIKHAKAGANKNKTHVIMFAKANIQNGFHLT